MVYVMEIFISVYLSIFVPYLDQREISFVSAPLTLDHVCGTVFVKD